MQYLVFHLCLTMKCVHTPKRIPGDVSQFFDQEAQVDQEMGDTDDTEEHDLGKYPIHCPPFKMLIRCRGPP